MTTSSSTLFDAYYYAHGCGQPYARTDDWLNAFDRMAQRVEQDIEPKTVLDAGCAMGFLVEVLRQRGIEAHGIDISEYAIGQVDPSVKPYCRIGSLTEPFQQRYDLIVCIEVLEHMERSDVEQAIENFAYYTDDVLFSSTPLDYKEATHFSVYPPEHWAELFARQGFYRDVDFDASFITPWAVRFRRRSDPTLKIARDYERKFWLLWKENQDLRALTLEMRETIAAQEKQAQEWQTGSATQHQQLEEQVVALRNLVQQYEQGRFMRFMHRVHQLRRRLGI